MQSITFECEVITPMFLAGADGQTPELRPPSIKGALRFWWRALHGHLPLKVLKERESAIFGSASGGRSTVIVRARIIEDSQGIEFPVPHKKFMKQYAFTPRRTKIEVKLSLTRIVKLNNALLFDFEHLKSLFLLTATLGGFGKRARRGMGSATITNASDVNCRQPTTLSEIYNHIQKFSKFFALSNDYISNTYSGALGEYGCIRSIAIGYDEDKTSDVTMDISKTTHIFHERDYRKYEATIGRARGGRMSSSVYVSVIEGVAPIVTTLNIATNKYKYNVSLSLQQDFVNAILKR